MFTPEVDRVNERLLRFIVNEDGDAVEYRGTEQQIDEVERIFDDLEHVGARVATPEPINLSTLARDAEYLRREQRLIANVPPDDDDDQDDPLLEVIEPEFEAPTKQKVKPARTQSLATNEDDEDPPLEVIEPEFETDW